MTTAKPRLKSCDHGHEKTQKKTGAVTHKSATSGFQWQETEVR